MHSVEIFESILRARVYHLANKTDLDLAPLLSRRLSNRVHLKREDMQPVFSFKLRGAANKIAGLSAQARAAGVLAASAGNHAQGVAMAARRSNIRATIVMPATTPSIKVRAVEQLGAEVVLVGENYDAAYEHMTMLAQESGATIVHPYDDEEVIAGQGTVAIEILADLPAPTAIFVPVGGGGLLAGVAAYTKRLYPETKIIGVEPEDAASMHAALAAGEPVPLSEVGIFADGVAVRQAGARTFKIVNGLVDEIIRVSTDEICAAVKDVYEDTRVVAEPAGALSVAGLTKWVGANPDRRDSDLVAIVSGANMNFDRLGYVSERAGLGDRSEVLLGVTIPERPGAFLDFCEAIGERSVTEFNYRYAAPGDAHIFVGVEASGNERDELIASLIAASYPVVDLTDDELAKLHIRHLVGGRHPDVTDERVFRFIFPERPGALLRFLRQMKSRWNVSLFHYRNHGAAFGRVLAGLQVADEHAADFETYLAALGYSYQEETASAAYQLFLSSASIRAEPPSTP